MVVIGQSGGIMAKKVVFAPKWLYSGTVVVFKQKGCIPAKVVVFEQKKVMLGQSGCIRTK